MSRSAIVMVAMIGGLGCRPSSTSAPSPTSPPETPASTQPEPTVAPSLEPASAPEPEALPLVHTELGWSREADDPAAPVVQLRHVNSFGPGGDALVEAIVGAAGALLTCWEARDDTVEGRVDLRVDLRAPSDPADDPLAISHEDRAAESVVRCADDAIRAVVPRPGEGAGAVVSFAMFPRRDEVRLRRASSNALVSVRFGTCWQWEDYPCAPNKRCKGDEWIRTTCGEPALRDDVELQLGLGTPKKGHAAPVDIRLVGGDGTVLWLHALPESVSADYGHAFEPAPAIAVRDVSFGLDYGLRTLVVADVHGVRAYDRKTGDALMSWTPKPGEPRIWFDDGEFVLRRVRTEVCRGSAGHGSFFQACGDLRVYFDGHSVALFEGEVPKLAEETALGGRGATLASSVMPKASFRLGKYRLAIEGIIYLE